METALLCKDDEDYDHLEKCFYVSAHMANCIVIIAIAMSNHGHCSLLAESIESAALTSVSINCSTSVSLLSPHPIKDTNATSINIGEHTFAQIVFINETILLRSSPNIVKM